MCIKTMEGPSTTVKPALNGNIFRSHDFGAEKDVKQIKRKLSNMETVIKISLYTEYFQSSRMDRLEEF
jgi:hypothetical protein